MTHFMKILGVTLTGGIVGLGVTTSATAANPTFAPGEARCAIGASYHLGGYSITNDSVPAIFNRAHASFTLAPIRYLDLGVDLGATQIEVASLADTADTIGVFHGKWAFSGGGHLKVSSPFFFNNLLAVVGIGEASYFSSRNANGAIYGGYDASGAAGVQLRIPQFGFLTAGARLYVIQGKNQDYTGETGTYSNIGNLRGWLALDFAPPVKGSVKGTPYFSFETSVGPRVKFGNKVPIKEISFSFSIGWISPRLWGIPTDEEEE